MDNLDYIGEYIFDFRRTKDISMDELSRQSGVSKSLISQIESGKVNPTINVLAKLANAMEVSLAELVDPNNQPQKYIKSFLGEKKPHQSKDGSFVCYTLNSKSRNNHVVIDYFEFKKRGKSHSKGHGIGAIEYIFVEEGELDLEFAKKNFTLKAGEIFEFKADGKHSYIQKTKSYASGIIVMFKP